MQTVNRAFLEILKIPHAEVWLVKNKSGVALAKGNLEVLYNKSLHLFILRVDDFKIALGKTIQAVGTLSEKSKYHSYLFAHPDGFLIYKIFDTEPTVPIENFETILQNNTQFVRKSGLEHRLDNFTHSGHKVKETIPKSHIDNSHPNQCLVRTYDELLDIEHGGVPVVDILSGVVQNLIDEGEELVRNHQDVDQWKEYIKWGGIEGNTITSGHEMPKEHDATTQLGRELEKLGFGPNKDLRIPEGHVDPSLGKISADVVANTDI